MPERLLVTGGLVIDPARGLEAVRDVLVEDGKISAVATGLAKKSAFKGAPVIDAKGKWVIPGLVDMHVHLREPGREGDETIETGTKAAARGGVTQATRPAMGWRCGSSGRDNSTYTSSPSWYSRVVGTNSPPWVNIGM